MSHFFGSAPPVPDKGIEIKAKALLKLTELTKVGKASDVMALRNLDTSPFKEGEPLVAKIVEEWTTRAIHSDCRTVARENAELIWIALSTSPKAWHQVVQESLRVALSEWKPSTASAIWQWWAQKPELVQPLTDFIPKEHEFEKNLVDAFRGKLPEGLGDKVRQFAETHAWYSLHACVVSSYCEPKEAFRRQLQFDTDPERMEGLRTLSARVQPKEVLQAAFAHDDTRLAILAGEASVKDPLLFAKFDVKNAKWREVWAYSIKSGREVWAGVQEPKRVVHSLMDILLEGEKVEPSLLLAIAATSYGDLTSYSARSQVWNKMGSQIADAFLDATAEGWIAQFKSNADFDMTIEDPLEEAVLDEQRLLKHFSHRLNMLSFGIHFFRRFTRLGERQFIKWLGSIMNTITYIEPLSAALLGKVIFERNWRNAAYDLYRHYGSGKRMDLVPALSECYDLLGWFQRFSLHGKMAFSVPEDEWWSALVDIVVRLYPKGPGEQYVWSRSGGDASLIEVSQPGRSQWISALQMLRNGGGGKQISVGGLLSQMRKDYYSSEELKILEYVRKS